MTDSDPPTVSEASLELLARWLHDEPLVKDSLLSGEIPKCDDVERDLVNELALRSLEIIPSPPGVQFVDENNIMREAETTND